MARRPLCTRDLAEINSHRVQYDKFLNAIDAFFWEADPVTFNCNFVSQQIERMLGHSVQEWSHPGYWQSCIHPDDRDRVIREASRRTLELRPYGLDYRLLNKAGYSVWVHDNVTVETRNGQPLSLFGITTDISEHKRTEQRLSTQTSVGRILEETRNIDEAAQRIPQELTRGLGWDSAHVWSIAAQTGSLWLLHSWPPESLEGASSLDATLRLRQTLAEHVCTSRETLMIPDLAKEPAPPLEGRAEGGPSGSALCFPVMLGNHVLGAVGVFSRQVHMRDGSLILMLEALGRSIGQFHQRQCADEAARLSEERHSRAQRIAHLGDWEMNINTGKGYWSDEECRLLGYATDIGEVSFERFISRVHPEDRDSIQHYTHAAIITGTTAPHNFRLLLPDGKLRVVRAELEVSRDRAGNPERLVGTMLDITELEKATEALRQSEERFRKLGTFAPVGIFSNDDKGHCIYINECGAALCGTTPERIMGLEWSQIIHPEDRERVLSNWIVAVRAGSEYREEYRLLTPRGKTPWISTVAVPLKSSDGTILGFVGTLVDISEHKRLDQLKNEFISMVSHELRTPITAIRGSLKLIASGITGNLPSKTRKMIDVAHDSCERLVHLVNDILDVERIETGRMILDIKPVELAPLVVTAVEANRPYALSFGIHVNIDNRFPEAWVQVDPERLIQVLTNLLSNAVKFSPKSAMTTVSVTDHQGKVRLSVIDHGPGISQAFRERIFNKFSQADSTDSRSKLGSGLGLNIAKAIVQKLGGEVGFDTVEGVGTTFYVDLPLIQAPPLTRPIPVLGRPTILSIEDDPHFAALLLGILDSAGFNADLASTVREAMDLLDKNIYVAMTLDLHVPDQDGLSYLRALRQQPAGRDLPVIVISAFLDEANRLAKGDAIGVVDWLSKPVDEERLKRALARATSSGGARFRILHVEDDPCERDVVHRCLEGKADVLTAVTLAEARGRLEKETFDLMILEAELPDGSGIDLLPLCHSSDGRRLPIILYSSQDVAPQVTAEVSAVLRKTSTSANELVHAIQSILNDRVFRKCFAQPGGRP